VNMQAQRWRRPLMAGLSGVLLLALGAWAGLQLGWWGEAAQPHIALILKTEKNPFFRKISSVAQAEAQQRGFRLDVSYGVVDGDSDTQRRAIERALHNRVTAIFITPNDGASLSPLLAQARQQGILVFTLDSPVNDPAAFDSFIGTDNFEAGRLIGQYVARQGITSPQVALLNLFPGHPVGIARRNGFLHGLGHADIQPQRTDLPRVPEVVCEQDSFGDDTKGGMALAHCLNRHPQINVVYAINEPAAAGAARVLKASKQVRRAVIVGIDGGCPGIEAVQRGDLHATSQQFPGRMASQAVQAVERFLRDGTRPPRRIDTGVLLITQANSVAGLKTCW
jgi:fructose transport system substrate-binding protein